MEAPGNNRSEMPLDVLGRTRATLNGSMGKEVRKRDLISKSVRAGDRSLQLSFLNEEYLVGASHHLAPNTSLPFVHTARRSYRLSGPVRLWEGWMDCVSQTIRSELSQTLLLRGRRSRNKVSVGEPAEGSFLYCVLLHRVVRVLYTLVLVRTCSSGVQCALSLDYPLAVDR